ncbi:MAG: hypothetical protein AAGI08_00570 [Bacteroidota bacterium]
MKLVKGSTFKSQSDSIEFELFSGFDNVIKQGETIYHLTDMGLGSLLLKDQDESEWIQPGWFVKNETDYFIYRGNYLYSHRRPGVAVVKLGPGIAPIRGVCVGYDDEYIVVESPDTTQYFNYKFESVALPNRDLLCSIGPDDLIR